MGYEENTNQMIVRANAIMNGGMELVDLFVNKNYLIGLDKCEPVALDPGQCSFSYLSLFEITKIVYDVDENINDKLVSVYSALSNFGSSAILVIVSGKEGAKFYLGTRDTRRPDVAKSILHKSLRGNFPGIDMREQTPEQIERLMSGRLPEKFSDKAVTAVSIVPSPRDSDKEHFVQGLEKFIDSMSGESYTAVFISSPLSKAELETKKKGYEELYSALSQCAEVSMAYSENESEAVAKGISESFTQSVNQGISDSTAVSSGTGRTVTRSHNHGSSFGFFGFGQNFGGGRSVSSTKNEGHSQAHAEMQGRSEAEGRSKTDTSTSTKGSASTLTVSRKNKTVQSIMGKIDEQLERIKSCESYGLWDSACYFIADDPETALVAANTFKAIVAGEKTAVENSFINLWDNDYEVADKSLAVMDSLRYGVHPRFRYVPAAPTGSYSEQIITPASLVSGVELPVLMGFPHKSVNGVTSMVSAEFGRNVHTKEPRAGGRCVDLGAVFHMGEVFKGNRVRLDLDSLTAHCFITGSTGSGKSNTTCRILEELASDRNKVKFLVIEPAKGEYKRDFGSMPGINVFTTNPKFFNMLCLDPFEFREEVHVLEHLDRLIEIFSACWPLYAAMPALLKAAFEGAYVAHGWDLNHSIHFDRGNGKFPKFADVLRILPELLEKSEFSAQTKGDYIGSLVTRVESLTNGLLGQIFGSAPVPDEVLFDENTIVDVSRIGSAETKALIMGVLVLKLSEYRQSTATGTNCPLKHVTVLEEAHNLLKRTSTEQGQESANLQGKSVEMISNSIAEMRTYGEGFIIVDQSPTSVDISAIKNTNTKIIMRLPDKDDRELAGKSMGLDDDQILELSRLDMGVAAVYQNDWLEAVLTKVDKCGSRYKLPATPVNDRRANMQMLGELIEELVSQDELKSFNMAWLNSIINSSKTSDSFKTACRGRLLAFQKEYGTPRRREAYNELIAGLLNCGDLFRIYEPLLPPEVRSLGEIDAKFRKQCMAWTDAMLAALDSYADFLSKKAKDSAFICLLLNKIATEKYNRIYKLVLYCI